MSTLDELKWDREGLIPALVQEARTGELLMLAWMDRQALRQTLDTGLAHYWSRSRQALWQKGETSGHRQHVEAIYADCDRDALLLLVHQEGVACHTGSRTCFFNDLGFGARTGPKLDQDPSRGEVLARAPAFVGPVILDVVERVIQSRKVNPPPGSYVADLLKKGEAQICRKIGEEASEVVTAALGGEGETRLVEEVADLWFHTMVLLGRRGISVRRVFEELGQRHAKKTAGSEGS
ncbi:MAG: bifunctional phosphoribosyl-AMP cyclohydrolase/phosphoribosyl-ATP diphosphatase HisIE [Candidatus Rokubacteria bacterium]|nr:bifunctional phosphoribosyl-AMP cyclohydrolase/phosphoribosyl-ATP diphosphatase HisIE [Candidatus Rokubacteria bacterium]